jgi:hypothetical protein
MEISPALIGKAGEVLVAGELMRRGIEIAYPASDRGIDMLAYRLTRGQTISAKFVPIQVKARAKSGFSFQRSWFDKAPGVALVYVWHLETPTPQFYETSAPYFYVFDSIVAVEKDLGAMPSHRLGSSRAVTM